MIVRNCVRTRTEQLVVNERQTREEKYAFLYCGNDIIVSIGKPTL